MIKSHEIRTGMDMQRIADDLLDGYPGQIAARRLARLWRVEDRRAPGRILALARICADTTRRTAWVEQLTGIGTYRRISDAPYMRTLRMMTAMRNSR